MTTDVAICASPEQPRRFICDADTKPLPRPIQSRRATGSSSNIRNRHHRKPRRRGCRRKGGSRLPAFPWTTRHVPRARELAVWLARCWGAKFEADKRLAS